MTRDAAKVISCLVKMPDSSVVCTKELQMVFPSRFLERSLAEIGVEAYVCGFHALVLDQTWYTVGNVIAMIPVNPTSSSVIKIEGVEYTVLTFAAGSVVHKSTKLLKKDTLSYRVYREFMSQGKIPVYFNYLDLGDLFKTAKKHADANVGINPAVSRLISSAISRSRDDKTVYYRRVVKSLNDIKSNPPVYVPLQSVIYSAGNTTSKLLGSHWGAGLGSALVNPTDRIERVEEVLRA